MQQQVLHTCGFQIEVNCIITIIFFALYDIY